MKRSTSHRLRTTPSRRMMLVLLAAGSVLIPLATTLTRGIGSAESSANFVMDKDVSESLQLMLFLHRAEPGPALTIPAGARAAESGDGRSRH